MSVLTKEDMAKQRVQEVRPSPMHEKELAVQCCVHLFPVYEDDNVCMKSRQAGCVLPPTPRRPLFSGQILPRGKKRRANRRSFRQQVATKPVA